MIFLQNLNYNYNSVLKTLHGFGWMVCVGIFRFVYIKSYGHFKPQNFEKLGLM